MAAGILTTEIILLFLRIIRQKIQCTEYSVQKIQKAPTLSLGCKLKQLRSFDETDPLLFNSQKMQFGR